VSWSALSSFQISLRSVRGCRASAESAVASAVHRCGIEITSVPVWDRSLPLETLEERMLILDLEN